MLLACRLAGLSALEAHYAVRGARAQQSPQWRNPSLWSPRSSAAQIEHVDNHAVLVRRTYWFPPRSITTVRLAERKARLIENATSRRAAVGLS
jgi:hypothetical protein